MSEAAPDVREVLEAAYNRIFCRDTLAGFICEPCDRLNRFTRFLDAEAYTDAALMLVPEGWSWSLGEMRGVSQYRAWFSDHNTPDGLAIRHADADALHPALAIAAAALRAKGTGT